MIEYNYLDLINKRKLHWIPPQFAKIRLLREDRWNQSNIVAWIQNNLSGRFAVTDLPSINEDKLYTDVVVAFEDHSEMTFFLLACHQLRSNK